jgi:hypothetical protein
MNSYRFNLHFDGERFPPDKWQTAIGADPLDAITRCKEFAAIMPPCVAVQLGKETHPNGAPMVIHNLQLTYGSDDNG